MGSGGHNKLTDAEKIARGTFRPSRSDEVYAERAGAKVVAFPRLREIPVPDLPLNEVGQKKYDELTRALFDADKLTVVTKTAAEQAAALHQEIHRRMSDGKPVPASLSDKLQRALAQLKIAEDAPTIASPGNRVNKFAGTGFSTRRAPPR